MRLRAIILPPVGALLVMSSAARGDTPDRAVATVADPEVIRPPAFVTLGPALLYGPALTEEAYVVGGELAFMTHPSRDENGLVCWPKCIGGLVQLETTNILEGKPSGLRGTVAVQLSVLFFGAELGPALQKFEGHEVWIGAHVGAFVSVGVASLGLRSTTVPGRFADGAGFDLHFVGTLPLTFAWYPDLGAFESIWHSAFGLERFGRMRL